jgi:hypothetical protein
MYCRFGRWVGWTSKENQRCILYWALAHLSSADSHVRQALPARPAAGALDALTAPSAAAGHIPSSRATTATATATATDDGGGGGGGVPALKLATERLETEGFANEIAGAIN